MTDYSGTYTAAFYGRQAPGSLRTARRVAPILYDLLAPTSVIDIGCGIGPWLAAFQDLGVHEVQGFDGSHVDLDRLLIPVDSFTVCDLHEPLMIDRTFDLAISLEVAEHLPAACAADFVRVLTGLSSAVLFSAAVPFQGGEGHVNEQWQDYWGDLFACEGYVALDCVRPVIWTDTSVEPWYAQNTILYVEREELKRRPDLTPPVRSLPSLRVVHPGTYLAHATRRPTLGQTVRRIPSALWESVVHRIRTLTNRGLESRTIRLCSQSALLRRFLRDSTAARESDT